MQRVSRHRRRVCRPPASESASAAHTAGAPCSEGRVARGRRPTARTPTARASPETTKGREVMHIAHGGGARAHAGTQAHTRTHTRTHVHTHTDTHTQEHHLAQERLNSGCFGGLDGGFTLQPRHARVRLQAQLRERPPKRLQEVARGSTERTEARHCAATPHPQRLTQQYRPTPHRRRRVPRTERPAHCWVVKASSGASSRCRTRT